MTDRNPAEASPQDQPSPALTTQDLCLSFQGLQALSNVEFRLAQEEILGIVGPNGSGKTCVLNIISGFYKPDKGRVWLGEREITGLAPNRIAQCGIARSFQHMELFAGMSVLDNLLVGCHPFVKGNLLSAMIYWGLAQKNEHRLRHRAEEILDFMELEQYRRQEATSLPIGVQKLVGVARALCAMPKILLLDEPSCGLSVDEKQDLARFILRIKHEMKIPMIWVEHDLTLIGDLSDRLMVLDHGLKVCEGSKEEIAANPTLLHIFGGAVWENSEEVSRDGSSPPP